MSQTLTAGSPDPEQFWENGFLISAEALQTLFAAWKSQLNNGQSLHDIFQAWRNELTTIPPAELQTLYKDLLPFIQTHFFVDLNRDKPVTERIPEKLKARLNAANPEWNGVNPILSVSIENRQAEKVHVVHTLGVPISDEVVMQWVNSQQATIDGEKNPFFAIQFAVNGIDYHLAAMPCKPPREGLQYYKRDEQGRESLVTYEEANILVTSPTEPAGMTVSEALADAFRQLARYPKFTSGYTTGVTPDIEASTLTPTSEPTPPLASGTLVEPEGVDPTYPEAKTEITAAERTTSPLTDNDIEILNQFLCKPIQEMKEVCQAHGINGLAFGALFKNNLERGLHGPDQLEEPYFTPEILRKRIHDAAPIRVNGEDALPGQHLKKIVNALRDQVGIKGEMQKKVEENKPSAPDNASRPSF